MKYEAPADDTGCAWGARQRLRAANRNWMRLLSGQRQAIPALSQRCLISGARVTWANRSARSAEARRVVGRVGLVVSQMFDFPRFSFIL